jgi:hypothetical protein
MPKRRNTPIDVFWLVPTHWKQWWRRSANSLLQPECRVRVLWRMKAPVVVEIIGAPVACKDGIKDSWREVAEWTSGRLRARFGDQVRLQYFDLFDPNCPTIPADGQLPVVLVNGTVPHSAPQNSGFWEYRVI